MSKKVDTATRQDILSRAWRVARPGEIDQLTRQAKGDKALARELKQVKKQLAKEFHRAELAEMRVREAEAKAAKYTEPRISEGRVTGSCSSDGNQIIGF